MSVYSFIKEVGDKIFGVEKEEAEKPTEDTGNSREKAQKENEKAVAVLKNKIQEWKLEIRDFDLKIEEDIVFVSGAVDKQETREKIILATGNCEGIAKVEESIKVNKPVRESFFHTIDRQENLKSIAEAHYNDESKAGFLLKANAPMLNNIKKPETGFVIRIPKFEKH